MSLCWICQISKWKPMSNDRPCLCKITVMWSATILRTLWMVRSSAWNTTGPGSNSAHIFTVRIIREQQCSVLSKKLIRPPHLTEKRVKTTQELLSAWNHNGTWPEVVGGVNSAREQDSSVGGGTRNNCLGVVHMEEGVQVRVQVEVGREEQSDGETHGKSQNEETTRNKRFTSLSMRTVQEKNDVWGVSVYTPVGYSGSPSTVNETNCNKKRSLKNVSWTPPTPVGRVPPGIAWGRVPSPVLLWRYWFCNFLTWLTMKTVFERDCSSKIWSKSHRLIQGEIPLSLVSFEFLCREMVRVILLCQFVHLYALLLCPAN